MTIQKLTPPKSRIISISSGNGYTLCVTADGKAISWGMLTYGGEDIIPDTKGKKFSSVSAGVSISLAIMDDGSVVGWGNPSFLGDIPPSLQKPI